MIPSDCRSQRDVCRLRRSIWEGRQHWISVQHDGVYIATQRTGEPPAGEVTIPRRTFQAMLDWYLRDQAAEGVKDAETH